MISKITFTGGFNISKRQISRVQNVHQDLNKSIITFKGDDAETRKKEILAKAEANAIKARAMQNISTPTSSPSYSENIKISDNLVEAMAVAGVVGAPLLIGMMLAGKGFDNTAYAGENHIAFLSDGTPVDITNKSIETDDVQIDADDGVFRVDGTGIDIRPERFDFVDVEKGIYRNSETGADIDLLNNKYIDPERGIFIDPEHKISAMAVGGELQNVVVPDFSFGSHGGFWWQSYPTPSHQTPIDTSEDNRTILEKIQDFLTPGNQAEYDTSNQYDIFGREITTATDSDGSIKHIVIPDEMKETFKDFLPDHKAEIVQEYNDEQLKWYMNTHNPDLPPIFTSAIDFDAEQSTVDDFTIDTSPTEVVNDLPDIDDVSDIYDIPDIPDIV